MRKYPNLVKETPCTGAEQVWVSDITYIKTEEGNCYINLVTDACSKKIMGYAIADNRETSSMIAACKSALANRTDIKSSPSIIQTVSCNIAVKNMLPYRKPIAV